MLLMKLVYQTIPTKLLSSLLLIIPTLYIQLNIYYIVYELIVLLVLIIKKFVFIN